MQSEINQQKNVRAQELTDIVNKPDRKVTTRRDLKDQTNIVHELGERKKREEI